MWLWSLSFENMSHSLFLVSSGVVSFSDPDDEIERLLMIAKQTLTESKPVAATSLGEELGVCIAAFPGVKGCPRWQPLTPSLSSLTLSQSQTLVEAQAPPRTTRVETTPPPLPPSAASPGPPSRSEVVRGRWLCGHPRTATSSSVSATSTGSIVLPDLVLSRVSSLFNFSPFSFLPLLLPPPLTVIVSVCVVVGSVAVIMASVCYFKWVSTTTCWPHHSTPPGPTGFDSLSCSLFRLWARGAPRRLQKESRLAQKVDYPAYGSAGPPAAAANGTSVRILVLPPHAPPPPPSLLPLSSSFFTLFYYSLSSTSSYFSSFSCSSFCYSLTYSSFLP